MHLLFGITKCRKYGVNFNLNLKYTPVYINIYFGRTGTGYIDKNTIKGFMPELYLENSRDPGEYYSDYLNTYIEKDLRQMIALKDLNAFTRFLTLLAGRVGQVVNLSSMAGEVGVSSTTLSEWLSVLESSYVVFKLQPYFSNISKRIIKSPKVYFVEPGLAAYLLGIQNVRQVAQHPLVGNLFENMVVADRMKRLLNVGMEPKLYYYRDSRQMEIDLVEENGVDLSAYEIKSSFTANEDFTNGLNELRRMSPAVKNCSVIYSGKAVKRLQGCSFVNYED